MAASDESTDGGRRAIVIGVVTASGMRVTAERRLVAARTVTRCDVGFFVAVAALAVTMTAAGSGGGGEKGGAALLSVPETMSSSPSIAVNVQSCGMPPRRARLELGGGTTVSRGAVRLGRRVVGGEAARMVAGQTLGGDDERMVGRERRLPLINAFTCVCVRLCVLLPTTDLRSKWSRRLMAPYVRPSI